MNIEPLRIRGKELYGLDLLMEGARTLSKISRNGIRLDKEYIRTTARDLRIGIIRDKKQLDRFDEVKMWRKIYGDKFKIGSGQQLSHIMFKELKLKRAKVTEKGSASTDEETLKSYKLPFLDILVGLKKKEKALNTYLAQFTREMDDEGFIHPSFNLHLATTYRSSSDGPNFQNIPIRNPEVGKLIRSAIIARQGRRVIEKDYRGIEVCLSACYHHDPILIEYIEDKTKDMHRDMAGQCYCIDDPSEVSKKTRYGAKNKFVFPEFYGSYYGRSAPELWKYMLEEKLTTTSGVLVKDVLAKKGIITLDAFTEHIRKVEDDFWNRRFKIYTKWKKRWWLEYLRKGYFDTLTGFRCTGPMARNDVLNYPMQGSAFHCLLWSAIKVDREIAERELSSLLIGQVHDSLIGDVPDTELDDYNKIADRVMTKDILKDYDWINVPLEVETEASPVNGSWYEKKPLQGE